MRCLHAVCSPAIDRSDAGVPLGGPQARALPEGTGKVDKFATLPTVPCTGQQVGERSMNA